ncbi:tyrosine-type recombinase/integrase [Rhizobium ruizarguesonis]
MSDKPPKSGEPGTAWNDPKTSGLRLRFLETKAAWYLYYRTKAGKQRNMKLGDERLLTLTAARDRAKEVLARVAKGEDPAGELLKLADRPTIEMLAKDHYEKHALVKNKPSQARDVESLYRVHIVPYFGKDKAVADITDEDVVAMHEHITKTGKKTRANRACDILSKGMNLAERWKWRPKNSNPVDIERNKETKRKRYPRADEAARLLLAMEKMEETHPHFIGLVYLILFTGARLSEIMAAQWDWVKEDGLHLPDSKSGEKVLTLSSLAREKLAGIPRIHGNPHIIVGRLKGKHLVNVHKPWGKLMKAAGITESLWRHDLRRFFASAGLSSGEVSLDQVGGLLAHASPETTKIYAHLMSAPAQKAADATAAAVKDIMTGGGKVVAIR